MGKGDSTALEALIQALDHPDPIFRYTIVRAILTISGDPKVVVPALIACLDDPASDVRREAAGWMEIIWNQRPDRRPQDAATHQ